MPDTDPDLDPDAVAYALAVLRADGDAAAADALLKRLADADKPPASPDDQVEG